MSQNLVACPLCHSAEFQNLYLAEDRHYGISGRFQIVQCENCSLVMLNPMYSAEELTVLYPTDYYAYQDKFQASRVRELARRILGYHVGTEEPVFQVPGTLLDIGCGSGWFLENMRARGWNTYGVEVSQQAVTLARESRDLQIFCGTLQDAKFPPEFFDYVRSNHSFEHISSPNETLDEIYRVLRPEGKLLIGVPNILSMNARLFKKWWWHLCAPVHTFNYSKDTLRRMLRKHRFQIEKVSFNSDYFGILGSIQIWLNRQNGRKSMEGMAVNNYFLRFACQCAANLADLMGQGDMIEITAVKMRSEEAGCL